VHLPQPRYAGETRANKQVEKPWMNNDDATDDILAKLDTIIAILQLAFKQQIDTAKAQILNDPIAATILDKSSEGWVEAGQLKK
jgi:hypothetical protein